MKQFISVQDAVKNPGGIEALIRRGLEYKASPLKDQSLGQGKRVGLLFMNPSMRTRVSTQIAAKNLGMDAIVLNMGSEGWALEFETGAIMNGTTVEHIRDAAPILGGFFDVICLRSFPKFQNRAEDESDRAIRAMIEHCGVPVVSLESSTRHPLQSLADLITIRETYNSPTNKTAKKRPKVVLTWAPHIKAIPHCVANSFAEWVQAWGEADFVITHPKGYELAPQYVGQAAVTHDQRQALEGADYVYAKNWSVYGAANRPEDYGKVLGEFPEWMLRESSFQDPKTRVMHCLPLRRNVELSDEVLDGPRSLLTQLGLNRVWSAQAVLAEILKSR
jgi:N-succinyl-L-ornithine transcarbamylase